MAEYIEKEAVLALAIWPSYELVEAGEKVIFASDVLDLPVKKRLPKLPAADVRENVRGEWGLSTGTDEEFGLSYPCSRCGEESIGKRNFCPNCGADMRGGAQ